MRFLETAISQFRHYKELAEKAMAQISDEALLKECAPNNNSIVILVRHMHGNMLSRWTNFLTEDGEKPWRRRDEEFEHAAFSRAELMELWESGWQCLFGALGSLTDADLPQTIRIRAQEMSAMDAILRQLSHYCYHVGQIILLCKQSAESWQSLSIPRNESAAYNAALLGETGPRSA
jgi:uncharacterized damage-inducible protein DinB